MNLENFKQAGILADKIIKFSFINDIYIYIYAFLESSNLKFLSNSIIYVNYLIIEM